MRLIRISSVLGVVFAGTMLATGCGGGGGGGNSADATPYVNPVTGTDKDTIADAISSPLHGGSGVATVSWVPPLGNTDGSALTDLKSYRIHYGDAANDYPLMVEITNPGLTAYTIENLVNGVKYFFVVTAVNSEGLESAYSEMVTKAIN